MVLGSFSKHPEAIDLLYKWVAGADDPLKNTGYFHHSITMEDIFRGEN